MKTEQEIRARIESLKNCGTAPCRCELPSHSVDCPPGRQIARYSILLLCWVLGDKEAYQEACSVTK
jgi:hypothetical protein